MSQPTQTQSNAGAVVIDANIFISICSNSFMDTDFVETDRHRSLAGRDAGTQQGVVQAREYCRTGAIKEAVVVCFVASPESDPDGVRRLAFYCQDDIHLAAPDQAACQPRVDLIEPDETRGGIGKKRLRIHSPNTHRHG